MSWVEAVWPFIKLGAAMAVVFVPFAFLFLHRLLDRWLDKDR